MTPFGVVFSAISWVYWLVVALALWWALKGRAPRRTKLIRVAAVLTVVVGLGAVAAWPTIAVKLRLQEATALFEERCKTAGESVSRRVTDVDGIVWMRWRDESTNYSDQWTLDDPYGSDCGGEGCISNLLRVTAGADLLPEEAARHRQGYRFIETRDPRDQRLYRYRASIRVVHTRTADELAKARQNSGGKVTSSEVYGFAIDREPIDTYSAEYGLRWNDISTASDRSHWIAGGSLEVVHLPSNDPLAVRVGFMIDLGLGSRHGARTPWLFAMQNACPPFAVGPGSQRRGKTFHETLSFASSVLKPRQE